MKRRRNEKTKILLVSVGLLKACKSNEEQVVEKFDPNKIDFSNFLS